MVDRITLWTVRIAKIENRLIGRPSIDLLDYYYSSTHLLTFAVRVEKNDLDWSV